MFSRIRRVASLVLHRPLARTACLVALLSVVCAVGIGLQSRRASLVEQGPVYDPPVPADAVSPHDQALADVARSAADVLARTPREHATDGSFLALARAQVNLGDRKAARATLDQVQRRLFERNEQSPYPWQRLGRAQVRAADWQGARLTLGEASNRTTKGSADITGTSFVLLSRITADLRRSGARPSVRANLAWARQMVKGEQDGSGKQLDLCRLATLEAAAGDFDAALERLNAIVARDPDSEDFALVALAEIADDLQGYDLDHARYTLDRVYLAISRFGQLEQRKVVVARLALAWAHVRNPGAALHILESLVNPYSASDASPSTAAYRLIWQVSDAFLRNGDLVSAAKSISLLGGAASFRDSWIDDPLFEHIAAVLEAVGDVDSLLELIPRMKLDRRATLRRMAASALMRNGRTREAEAMIELARADLKEVLGHPGHPFRRRIYFMRLPGSPPTPIDEVPLQFDAEAEVAILLGLEGRFDLAEAEIAKLPAESAELACEEFCYSAASIHDPAKTLAWIEKLKTQRWIAVAMHGFARAISLRHGWNERHQSPAKERLADAKNESGKPKE